MSNEKHKCLEIWWYGDGEVFINQISHDPCNEYLTVLGRDACQALIVALQQSQAKS